MADNPYGPIKARGDRGWFIFDNLILDGVNEDLQIVVANSGWEPRFHCCGINEMKNFRTTASIWMANNITIQNNADS